MFPPVHLRPVYQKSSEPNAQMAAWMQERNFRGTGVGDNTDEPDPIQQEQPQSPKSPVQAPNPVDIPDPVEEEQTDEAMNTATESGPTQSEYSLISRTLDNEMR